MSVSKSNQRLALTGAILALITLAVYWTLLSCQFIIFDDDRYVTANFKVRGGLTWADVTWAFHTIVCSNWHPLTLLSHMLDCQLWGLNPAYHHLTNLLFHIANSVLLLVWLHRVTGALWPSALVAALFAWHPLHVESVAWVAERKDVLSTFFWLLTLLAYARYVEKFKVKSPGSKVWYGLTLLGFALGLMSKPMVVTLPCVLLLVDYWPLKRFAFGARNAKPAGSLKGLLLEKIPFFLLAAVSCGVTMFVQNKGGAVVNSLEILPVEYRIGNALIAYFRYLRKTVWPSDLAVYYPHPGAWPGWQVFGAGAFLLSVTLLVLKCLRGRPYLAMGWFWFLGTLVPVIGLVQVGGQSMADRYSYIPLIGIFIMGAWGANDFAGASPRLRKAVIAFSGLALAGCLAVTAVQATYWRTSETIFKHAIAVTGDNYTADMDLGSYLVFQDREKEALPYFKEAVRIKPTADAEVNLGDTLVTMGDLPAGAEHLNRALQIDPDHYQAHFSLGKLHLKQDRKADAAAEFRESLRLKPGWPAASAALAKLLMEQGDLKGAAEQTALAAEGDPQNPEIEVQLATLLSQQQRVAEAVPAFQEALRRYRKVIQLSPDNPDYYNNLAWLLATNPNAEIRNGTEAVAVARRACELTHRQRAQLIGTLAAALAEAGQFDEAVKTAQEARDLALKSGEKEIAARNEELIKLYQAHQPYRDSN